jgi:hypothetical protein
VNGHTAALAIIIGAALLAGWVDVRFPRLTPQTFISAGLHVVAAMLALQLGMRMLGAVPHDSPMMVLTALFGAALPTTIYLVLSAFWLLKLLHGMVDRRHGSPR